MLYVSASLSSRSVSVIVGPIAKETGPGLVLWGVRGTAGAALLGLLNAPSGDGEIDNAIGVVSFRGVDGRGRADGRDGGGSAGARDPAQWSSVRGYFLLRSRPDADDGYNGAGTWQNGLGLP